MQTIKLDLASIDRIPENDDDQGLQTGLSETKSDKSMDSVERQRRLHLTRSVVKRSARN